MDAEVLDTTFVLYADHTMNASTFTARVVASTLSDMFSAVSGAIGALKGPLHGGANEEAKKMAEEVGKPENAEAYVRERLAAHEKIMGFGHAVYRTMDPRATVLKRLCKETGERVDQPQWYKIFAALEATTLEQKGLYPNVDLYAAGVYTEARDPDGPDDPAVRARPHGGVDRARARAVREQPHHPARLRIRRTARPNLAPDRGAPMSDHDITPAGPPPPPPAPPAAQPSNGMAVASLVLGILSILCSSRWYRPSSWAGSA